MNLLPLGAAGIFALLGALHLIYTLSDMFGRPRYFAPRDPALLEAMRATRIALAPGGRDMWSVYMGFNLTHSLSVLLLALLIVLAVVLPLPALKLPVIALGLLVTLISWACFFHIPTIACAVASALMIVGWVLAA
jgi:hypothetical protein